jgi:hypothetical protein
MQTAPTNLNARESGRARKEKSVFNCSAYATFPFPVICNSANSGKLRVGSKFYTFFAGHFVGTITSLHNCVLKPITNVQQKLRKTAFIKEELNNLTSLPQQEQTEPVITLQSQNINITTHKSL